MNYGTDLKVKRGIGGGSPKGNKSKERPGAARGQGESLGEMNKARISKAMSEVKGVHGGKPEFYCGGMKG